MSEDFAQARFVCVLCRTFAQQKWGIACADFIPMIAIDRTWERTGAETEESAKAYLKSVFRKSNNTLSCQPLTNLAFSECQHCSIISIWHCGEILYPTTTEFTPHQDLPEECHDDFIEACRVVDASPRAASALLRACMEKLLKLLTGSENPNEAIRTLVRDGMNQRIQQAMDVVRVTGNKALHGYEISEEAERAANFKSLVDLLNLIVEDRITRPAVEKKLFDNLPEGELKRIEKRDS